MRVYSRFALGLMLALFVAVTGRESVCVAVDDASADRRALSAEQISDIGRQAYVWGWPLVYLHQCRNAVRYVKAPGRAGGAPVAPLNQLAMMTDYISASAKAAPCPNQDVVYGFGMLDLGKEPVVLQVPDFGDRFWLFQLGDQRTDRFAKLGKMHGSKPGFYLIAGPEWEGETPEGIVEVLRCPTRIGYCIPRVFQQNSDEDKAAIQSVLSQISLYPLSKFDGEMKSRDWTKSRWYPNLGQVPGQRGKRFAPEQFLAALGEVLEEAPALPGEEDFYQRLRKLLDHVAVDAESRELLLKTFDETEKTVMTQLFEFRNIGERLPHGWTTLENGGEFGLDYVTRAAVARSNIFVNANEESKYFYQDFDVDGQRLLGSREYKITFPAGKLPPTKGFWSLTLYDAEHSLYENEAKRYAIGAKDQNLRYNADGSLTIYVQHAPPPAGWEMNWLPAPEQEFSLYLRAYWPEAAILTGNWTPPAVVQNRPQAAPTLAKAAAPPAARPSPSTVAARSSSDARRFAIRRNLRAGRR